MVPGVNRQILVQRVAQIAVVIVFLGTGFALVQLSEPGEADPSLPDAAFNVVTPDDTSAAGTEAVPVSVDTDEVAAAFRPPPALPAVSGDAVVVNPVDTAADEPEMAAGESDDSVEAAAEPEEAPAEDTSDSGDSNSGDSNSGDSGNNNGDNNNGGNGQQRRRPGERGERSDPGPWL